MDISQELCDKFLKQEFDTRQWSYSAVSSFNRCPYSWYKTYILKEKSENYHNYIGSCFHKAVEDFYNFYLGGGRLERKVIIETLQKKLTVAYNNNPHVGDVPMYMDKAIRKNVINSLVWFAVNPDIKYVERKIEYKIDDYNFVGYLDLDEGAGKWHYDWKSKVNDSHHPQQNLYMYGKKLVDGVKPTGFGIIPYKQNLQTELVKYNREDVSNTVESILEGIRGIKEALLNGDFPEKPVDLDKKGDSFFCEQLCRSESCPFYVNKITLP